jgi:hypothetical protein
MNMSPLISGSPIKLRASQLKLFLFTVLIIQAVDLRATYFWAIASGNWSNTAIWSTAGPYAGSCSCVPGPGDDVIIDGYDVTMTSATGSKTISSLHIISQNINGNASLKVQNGVVLTVTGLAELLGYIAGMDQTLEIDDNSRVNIGSSFLLYQNTGDDQVIDIEHTGTLYVAAQITVIKDGGDDIDFRLNENFGTGATLSCGQIFSVTINNFDQDGVHFLLNGSSCQFNPAWGIIVNAQTANNTTGQVTFSLNAGTMTTNYVGLNRADDCGNITFNMNGGNLVTNNMDISSGGPVTTASSVRFLVDGSSSMTVWNNLNVTLTGGGNFGLETNVNSGTAGTIHVANSLTINRSAGGDVRIYSYAANSLIDIDGSLSITSTGGGQTQIDLYGGQITVGGNLSIYHTEGQTVRTYLNNTGAPLLSANNMSVTMAGGADNFSCSVNSGTVSIAQSGYFYNNPGSGNSVIKLDGTAQMAIAGDLTYSLSGGTGSMTIGLGETTAGSTCKLDVGGHLQMIHNYNNAAALMYLRVYNNTEVEAGQLTLTQTYTAPALFLVDVPAAGVVDIDGNINLNAAGGGEVEMRMAGTSTLQVMGNITRAASPNMFGKISSGGTSITEFNGNTPQIIAQSSGNGGDEIYYRALTLNNSSNTYPQFTMQGVATINNTIKFTDGVVATTASNILIIPDNVTATSASDASFVEGPVRKIGNDAFTFPVGDNNYYQSIAISAPSAGTDIFEAQYFGTDPGPTYDSTQKAAGINHVSKCEYWILNRTNGTSNVVVGLSWDSHSCGVTNLSDLRVARWNGSQWANHGNGGTAGNTTAGTINTSTNVTSFSPFTLASSQRSSNPLPVELTEFNAVKSGDVVLLEWNTAVEKNCNYFEIERSPNGAEWEFVTSQKALGSNTDYNAEDMNPHKGVSYYRLKSIDVDGSFSHSKIVVVNDDEVFDFKIYPNPANHECFVEGPGTGNAELVVSNALGQILDVPVHSDNENRLHLNTSSIAAGVYLLRISIGGQIRNERLFIHH